MFTRKTVNTIKLLVLLVTILICNNLLFAKYPDFQWAKRAGGSLNDNARSIATDNSGNSFITGYFRGSVNFGLINLTSAGGSDIFVAKYDASGNVLWAKRIGGSGNDYGRYIETDGSGNAIVTGEFFGSVTFGSVTLTCAGSSDIFIAKYDASGDVQWAKRAGGTGLDSGFGVDADWSGNIIIITGYFYGTATFDSYTLTSAGSYDIFIAKYDASGNVLWATRAGGKEYDLGDGIIIAESGGSIITGHFNGSATFGSITLASAGGSDIFIAKYDAAGNVLWAKKAGGTGNDFGYNVTRDGSYNGVITGSFQGSATFGSITLTSAGSNDIFIAKYDPSGNVLWARRAGGANYDSGQSIAADESNSSVVTGFFDGSATFGTTTLTSAGSRDIFIVKYDDSGNVLWASRAGGKDMDMGYGIAADGSGDIIVTGNFNGSATFGTTTLTSAGKEDIFITKLMETPSWITVTYPNGGEVLYVGNSYTITWTTDNYAALVEIALSIDGGSSWINLTDPSYAPNTGSYNYTPEPKHVSNNCLIQITSIEDATVTDISDDVFSITYVKQYVAMRLPAGVAVPTIDGILNESFWTSVDADSLLFGGVQESWNTKWTYWNDNLVSWKAVWSEVTNKLYVAITVSDDIRGVFDNSNPNDISFAPYLDECLEIFTDGDHSGGFYEDTYDNAQQWMVTGENKIVLDDFPTPTKYSIYTGNDLKTAVSWGINGNWICEAEFKIYDTFPTIRKNLKIGDIIGWNLWYDDSDNETLEDGLYGRDHQVGWLYTGTANTDANYFGDLVLGGDLPYISVISPNGGEQWQINTSQTIKWSSFGAGANVKIELNRDGGINWETLFASTPNDGSAFWLVTGPPSNLCLIRIMDLDGFPIDESDNSFKILLVSPPHFTTVWTGNPFQPMTIYCTKALLHGIGLAAGDEIGVFDGNKCVGTKVLTQTPTQQNPVEIICSKDDGTGNGFTEGNPIIFKIWDQSGVAEYSTKSQFIDLQTGAPLNPIPFTGLGTAAVQLTAGPVTQPIVIYPGWNIFSLAVTPEGSHEMTSVLSSILPALVKVIDEQGHSIVKLFGKWVNSIGNWQATEGYYINVTQKVTLHVTGMEITTPLAIPLKAGWNIISYPCLSAVQDAKSVVQPLIDSGYLVKVIDEKGYSIVKIFGNWNNSIGKMIPGEGYLVNVNSNCTLSLECGGVIMAANDAISTPIPRANHFKNAPTGNPYEPMNIFVVDARIDGKPLANGDEIAVFDDAQCVGIGVLRNPLSIEQPLEIIVNKDDDGNGRGFRDGDKISFRIWKNYTGEELLVQAASVQYFDPDKAELAATSSFEGLGTAVVAINRSTNSVVENVEMPQRYHLYQNHPNPFNPTTMISYDLPEATPVKLDIYDLQGNLVRSLVAEQQDAGHHAVEWNARNSQGMPIVSGIYFYKLTTDQFIATKKMVMTK